MVPASIIGVTSAVISFVGFIGNAVKVACELSDTGGIDEYERLCELTIALGPGIADLEKRRERQERVGKQLFVEEKSCLQVAQQCKQVGRSIRVLMDEMGWKSGLDSARASTEKEGISVADKLRDKFVRAAKSGRIALAVIWKKKEAEDLRRQFDSCTIHLNAYLTMMAR